MQRRHRVSISSHAASWRRTEGEEVEGATPPFSALVRHGGGHGWKPRWHPFAPPCGEVAPSTVIPGGKAIERCRGQGRSTDRSGFPTGAGPAVLRGESGPGGVSGCSGMPGSEKVQPARQSSRIQGGQDTVERFPVASRAIEASVMGEGEGSGGGDGGARGAHSLGRGSKGPEPSQPQCMTLGRLAPLYYALRRRPRCPRLARPSSAAPACGPRLGPAR